MQLALNSNNAFNLNVSYKYGIINPKEFVNDKISVDVWTTLVKNREIGERKIIRNILLIGSTGNGKSSLANTLVNKNNNFEEIFKESASSVSETKDYKTIIFEEGGITYRVIDTIGVGDTQLSNEETFKKLSAAVYELSGDGLNRVFFVISKRVDERAVEILQLLSQTLFDQEIVNYCTVVKTSFSDFENEEAWKKDLESLKDPKEVGSKIIKAIGEENVIYIDNPPLKGRLKQIEANKEVKEIARKNLFSHLQNRETIYKPENLWDWEKRIKNHTGEIEKDIDAIQEKLEGLRLNENANKEEISDLEIKLSQFEKEKAKKVNEQAELLSAELKAVVAQRERNIATIPIFGLPIVNFMAWYNS